MSVSVAIIARNSEDVIERCLESVKTADEIIVIDTGSETDETINIARRYTDKVYTYYGCNEGGKRDGVFMDFSAARNEALRYCSMSHVLTIDTDEVFEGNMKALKEFTGPGISFRCISDHTGEEHRQPRLYRNDPMVKWSRPIHNFVNVKGIYSEDFVIRYYTNKQKVKDPDRTVRILNHWIRNNRDNAREMYYLAREYQKVGRIKEAYRLFKKYLRKSKFPEEKADAFVLLARACVVLKKYEEAVNCAMAAVNMNPQNREALELAGDLSPDINRIKWRHLASAATNSGVLFKRPDNRLLVTVLSIDNMTDMVNAVRKQAVGMINIETIPPEHVITIGLNVIRQRIAASDVLHTVNMRSGAFAGINLPKNKTMASLETDPEKLIKLYEDFAVKNKKKA